MLGKDTQIQWKEPWHALRNTEVKLHINVVKFAQRFQEEQHNEVIFNFST